MLSVCFWVFFLPCTVETQRTQAKTNFRPHTLSHTLENIAAQYSLNVGSVQCSLYSRCLTSISSMRSVDLDSLWPPCRFGASLGHLRLSLNTLQQQHTASQHCPCPVLTPPSISLCSGVYDHAGWALQPCLACPAAGLRLAIRFCLGLWLGGDSVLYISVTPQ